MAGKLNAKYKQNQKLHEQLERKDFELQNRLCRKENRKKVTETLSTKSEANGKVDTYQIFTKMSFTGLGLTITAITLSAVCGEQLTVWKHAIRVRFTWVINISKTKCEGTTIYHVYQWIEKQGFSKQCTSDQRLKNFNRYVLLLASEKTLIKKLVMNWSWMKINIKFLSINIIALVFL